MANATAKSSGNGAHADFGNQHVATVYAKGLLGASEAAGQTETVLQEFDSLVGDVLDKLPKFTSVLFSGMVPHEEKIGMIDRSLGRQASPLMLNFLKVLSAHGRLNTLRSIHRTAHDLYDQMRNRVRVQVITATPLDGDQTQRVTATLRGMLGGEPVLERVVDPNLIGGIVLRIGDTVYDGSVAAQLEQLRTQMINRSVHEIQSRRNRFGDSAGN
jgi:F-type H+-transporting ATPase subunit delta